MKHPNILCFVTDHQRADHLGCYGNPDVQTPNIDRLAREGVMFQRAFVANPKSRPNRASLVTGLYPKVHGVCEDGIPLNPAMPLLPDLLRRAGYQTASFGKLHLAPYAVNAGREMALHEIVETPEFWAEHANLPTPYAGFETVYLTGGHGPETFGHYLHDVGRDVSALLQKEHALERPAKARDTWKAGIDPADHYVTRIADQTIHYVKEHVRGGGDRPFFIWCSFPDPHAPYAPPAPYCDFYDPQALRVNPARRLGEFESLPSYFGARHNSEQRGMPIEDDHLREIYAHVYGLISLIDGQIGRVVSAVEALGLLDTTLITFMSAQGDLLGDHWLFGDGPFLFESLVKVPLIWRLPGAGRGSRVSWTHVSAVDFAPTILDCAGIKAPASMQGESYRAVLTMERARAREQVYIECDAACLQDRLRQLRTEQWAITFYTNSSHGLLYNLEDDPLELYNMWDDPAHRGVKAELLQELLRESTRADSRLPASSRP